MTRNLRLLAVGHATSLFLAITYGGCVVFGILFPAHKMPPVLESFMPETTGSPDIAWGALQAYGYGWYFALVWTPLYNISDLLTRTRRSPLSTRGS